MPTWSGPFFRGGSINDVVRSYIEGIGKEAAKLDSAAIKAESIETIKNRLFEKYRLRIPEVDESSTEITAPQEVEIPTSDRSYDSRHGQPKIKGTSVCFRTRFTGDPALFYCGPTRDGVFGGLEGFEVVGDRIEFCHECPGHDAAAHKSAFGGAIAQLKKCLAALRMDAADADKRLLAAIESVLGRRASELAELDAMAGQLGFPVNTKER